MRFNITMAFADSMDTKIAQQRNNEYLVTLLFIIFIEYDEIFPNFTLVYLRKINFTQHFLK